MKKGYRIGLFFLCFLIIMVMALLLWKRYAYHSQQLPPAYSEEEKQPDIEKIEEEPDVTQAQQAGTQTTCDTICVYENIDMKDGTVTLERTRLPDKYIGMTRRELEKAMADATKMPTLEDREKGFQSQQLELFSTEMVKIVRVYDTTVEESGYYIMAVNHEIWIYREDKTSLYFKTDLLLEDLPEQVQQEVVKGKYMATEEEIYNFLESYSS